MYILGANTTTSCIVFVWVCSYEIVNNGGYFNFIFNIRKHPAWRHMSRTVASRTRYPDNFKSPGYHM